MTIHRKKILIIGGGFAGIGCALDLDKQNLPNTKIVLVSDKTHFEYHPALYKVVTGRSPLEVCIPLDEIFKDTDVEVVEDKASKIILRENLVVGESNSKYFYDYLILALGSRTTFFGIEGLKENSFGFKSITEALKLKNHIHDSFENYKKDSKNVVSHIVVVGGGTSGVELAGELAVYTKNVAKIHGVDEKYVKIDLIEAKSRLASQAPPDVSKLILKRLKSLGVNVMLNTKVLKKDLEKIYLENQEIETKTLIWTAGVKGNKLYRQTQGLDVNKLGKVEVDNNLHPRGFSNVYVAGDGAATKYSGAGQTAVLHSKFIAKDLTQKIDTKSRPELKEKVPVLAIPVGPGWAVVKIGGSRYFGKIGWLIRQAADLRYFMSILPLGKALTVFKEGRSLCETCKICEPPKDAIGQHDKITS